MAKKRKLNSIRLLEARKIPHEIHTYDARIRDAQAVAEAVGMPAETVFKTLVAEVPSQSKPILVLLPCNSTLNLKRLAKSLGAKKAALASHADAEKLTGLQVGGISALALLQKRWDVYLDKRALEQSHLVISAGERGTQARLETKAFIDLVSCEIIDVADASESS
ncbi:MAG: aminoacyl-tRNA deacylase [Chloroflexi bacterium]|nr:aminoacyl-tRNA deacylase [Chloroflexota bacterium]